MNKTLIVLATIIAMGIGTTAAAANAGRASHKPAQKHSLHQKHVKHAAKAHVSHAKAKVASKPQEKKLSTKKHAPAKKQMSRVQQRHS